MIRFFKTIFSLPARRLKNLQIEVTSRCNLEGCLMCPRTAFPDQWHKGDISWQTYGNISRFFYLFDLIYLSGWGEPLVHPKIWDMVELAKERGRKVGFTTNGLWMDDEVREKLLNYVDILGVSVDGVTAETYERIRHGSNLEQVIQNIKHLIQLRRQKGQSKPEVAILFMKMKMNIHELVPMIELAAHLGVDKIVATNLDYLAKPLDESLRAFSDHQISDNYLNIVKQAQEAAKRLSITFKDYPLAPYKYVVSCELSPLETIFVSWQGNIAPCVYLCLPLKGKSRRIFYGEEHELENLIFANIDQMDLEDLWQDKAYQNFLSYFSLRKKAFEDHSTKCGYLIKNGFEGTGSSSELPSGGLADLSLALEWSGKPKEARNQEIDDRMALLAGAFPFPPVCRSCYKTLGM